MSTPAPLEERAALALQLRRAGVRDVGIMRALELAPREDFAPYRFRDLANRDIALPIGCGQTMPSAADLGRRLEILGVQAGDRVLEIGSGSGYSAAVLARIAREVVSLERYRSLATEAAARLERLGVGNAHVVCADGLAPNAAAGSFDRIILHVALSEAPRGLYERLAEGGAIVFGRRQSRAGRTVTRLVRVERKAPDSAFVESDRGSCRLPPVGAERARAL